MVNFSVLTFLKVLYIVIPGDDLFKPKHVVPCHQTTDVTYVVIEGLYVYFFPIFVYVYVCHSGKYAIKIKPKRVPVDK